LLLGCTGEIIPPTGTVNVPGGGSNLAVGCPRVPDPPPKCGVVAVTNVQLSCNGAPAVFTDPSHNGLGVALPTGSVITANVRSASAFSPCHGVGATFPIKIVLGLTYNANFGPNAPLCIARSKLAWTQFDVSGSVFNGLWDNTVRGMIQDSVQLSLDQALISQLSTPAPGSSPRCVGFVNAS
jgi:hypothetical protein